MALMDALQNKCGMERGAEVVHNIHAPDNMAAVRCETELLLTVVSEVPELSRTLEMFAAA